MFKHLWVLALLGALAVLGCGQVDSGPSEVGTNPSTGLDTMAEVILDTPIIAHVSVTSVTMGAAQWSDAREDMGEWTPVLEITFKVLEYLKGTGGKTVVAYVQAYQDFDSRAEAENQTWLMEAFDDRWNDREAIVFLDDWAWHMVLPDDRLYLGGIMEPGSDTFSITSHESRKWLPAAPASGVRSATDSDPAFLLSAPTAQTGTRSTAARSADSSTGSTPTIRLSALKAKINTLEADANAGGEMYRQCLIISAESERMASWTHLADTNTTEVEMASGQPAGTVLHEGYLASGLPPDKIGRHWFEGDDPHIVTTTVSNIRTEPPLNTRNYVELILKYTTHLRTTRPLPAGSYQFFHNHQHPFNAVCDGHIDTNFYSYELTVTAPDRVLHEVYFDPVTIGTAVGADSANGVLSPAGFSLNNTNTTISSLKWEDGAVTMTLSPTASLADYAIDFIDTTGTTTLSLTSDNASTTPLTWTVADAPWAAGDLLMLRIQEPAPPPPVTVTITPRPEGRFTFFDLTVSWNDPQACDGRYFVYVGTDTWVIRNLGFHAASVSTVTSATGWRYDSVPDHWVFVRCDSSGGGQSRDVGRASLRAALE